MPEDAESETGDHRPGSVTVHDSCYLARYNNVIAAPRDVLGAAGVSITEMEKSGKNTFCCGAGGARMWMEETRGTRINENRTRQVLATHDQETGQQADSGRRRRSCGETAQRLSPSMPGKKPRRVCADAEKRGVAERDNARVTHDQIERKREQSRDEDLAAKRQIARKDEIRGHRKKPECDLQWSPLRRGQRACGGALRRGASPHTLLPTSPRGKTSSMITITT